LPYQLYNCGAVRVNIFAAVIPSFLGRLCGLHNTYYQLLVLYTDNSLAKIYYYKNYVTVKTYLRRI